MKGLSYGARYLQTYFTLKIAPMNTRLDDITCNQISEETCLSLSSVYKYIDELKDKEVIRVERNPIFRQGPGSNSYILFERAPETWSMRDHVQKVVSNYELKPIEKTILITLLMQCDKWGVIEHIVFDELSRDTGISINALLANIDGLIKSDYIFSVFKGGLVDFYRTTTKPSIYLNLKRIIATNIHGKSLSYCTGYFGGPITHTDDISLMFSRRFDFFELDPIDYFSSDYLPNGVLKEYFSFLDDNTRDSTILFLTQLVDKHTSEAMRSWSEDAVQYIRQEIEGDAIEFYLGSTITSIDIKKLKEQYKKGTFSYISSRPLENELNSKILEGNTWFTPKSEIYKELVFELMFLISTTAYIAKVQSIELRESQYKIIREANGLIVNIDRESLPRTVLSRPI
ncbi:hypothetical protein [Thalassotalea aquiviva]|uniref:hypothetical protein n=1 Tax=Thalassotalea aquiviva TaxID=3242415 RepID=UPI00352B48AB